MADIRERVEAEMENIQKTLAEIPPPSRCPHLSTLELAGAAALLHSFYNGIENIIKQMLQSRQIALPTGDCWHRDLLELACRERVIGNGTLNALKPYLAFRHFFSHAYALDLHAPRMAAIVEDAARTFSALQRDIESALAAPSDQ